MLETILMGVAAYAGYLGYPIWWSVALGIVAGIWNSLLSQVITPWWVNKNAAEEDKIPVRSPLMMTIYFIGMMILGAASFYGVHYAARYLTAEGTFGPDPSISQPVEEESNN